MELKGSLSGIGLPAIVQLMGEVRHSGNLDLHKGARRGTLAFNDGRLVAAECGEHHGLQALADCVLELADGDFTFIEGIPRLERTLDFGPSDLTRLIDRVSSGEFQLHAIGTSGTAAATEIPVEAACPLLGFADDEARHYSRPTALHRCYAAGGPSLVTAQEQRELCLSGRFATCPRYRNDGSQPVATLAEAATATTVSPPEPDRKPQPPSHPRVQPVPEMPPGVAARLAAGNQMQLADEPPPVPPGEKPATMEPEDAAPSVFRAERRVTLVVGSVVLGVALVGLFALVVLPALRPTAEPSAALDLTVEPTLAEPAVVVTQAAPTLQPTQVRTLQPTEIPTPTAVSLPTPTALARSAAASQTASRGLMDVRFAAGPPDRWVDNPPYATWSDGAYRFQAHDPTRFVAVGVPLDQTVSDVVLTASFRKTGGPPGGGYGLIVRDQGPEPRDGVNQDMTAYVLEIGDKGEYGVWRRDRDHWVDLVPWTPSSSVRSGGSPNELAVRATGDAMVFSVNGAELAPVHDTALDAGGVGLFVGGDTNEVALDHFTVQVP